jgi:hypothetical protein
MSTLIADWLNIGKQLGVDFKQIDPRAWVEGCDHEMEHYDTVEGNPVTIAKIALDHLREMPDYYKKLKRMEAE